MKQNITTKQLSALTKDKYAKLSSYIYAPMTKRPNALLEKEVSKQLTIGRLIEIVNSIVPIYIYNDGKQGFSVATVEKFNNKSWKSKELCDALWEALKEIL